MGALNSWNAQGLSRSVQGSLFLYTERVIETKREARKKKVQEIILKHLSYPHKT